MVLLFCSHGVHPAIHQNNVGILAWGPVHHLRPLPDEGWCFTHPVPSEGEEGARGVPAGSCRIPAPRLLRGWRIGAGSPAVGPVMADRLGGLLGSGRTGLVASGGGPVHLCSPPCIAGGGGAHCRAVDGRGTRRPWSLRDEGEWITVTDSLRWKFPHPLLLLSSRT